MTRPSRLLSAFVLSTAALGLAACEFATPDGWIRSPFEGPAYTMDDGLVGDFADDHTFVAATTYLPLLDTPEAQAAFDDKMVAIQELLDAKPEGLVGVSFSQAMVGKHRYRTLTVWESYDAMYAFVMSDAHAAAMASMSDIAEPGEARTVAWEINADQVPPTWDDAVARVGDDQNATAY